MFLESGLLEVSDALHPANRKGVTKHGMNRINTLIEGVGGS